MPAPFFPHHRPTFAPPDRETEAVINHARSVALVQIFNHRYLIAGSWRHTEFELHHVTFFRQLDLLDLIQRLDAALHLRRLGRVRPEAVYKALLLCQHGLLPRKRRLLVGLANGALALVEIVIAGVGDNFTRIDFRNLRNDAVHEFAVVRSHHQRTRERFEELLQPDDRLDVQVVGRFVHQQHVGPSEQHARQRNAHFPSARQCPDVAIDLVIFEAQAMQYFARLRLERISVEMLVLFLDLTEARENLVHVAGLIGIVHGTMQRLQLVMQIADAPAARDGFIENRAALHFFDVLTEVADRHPLRNRDLALVRIFLADDHAEEGGLAGAVGADESNLLARIQLKGSVNEDQLFAILLVDIRERDHPKLHVSRALQIL